MDENKGTYKATNYINKYIYPINHKF